MLLLLFLHLSDSPHGNFMMVVVGTNNLLNQEHEDQFCCANENSSPYILLDWVYPSNLKYPLTFTYFSSPGLEYM